MEHPEKKYFVSYDDPVASVAEDVRLVARSAQQFLAIFRVKHPHIARRITDQEAFVRAYYSEEEREQ